MEQNNTTQNTNETQNTAATTPVIEYLYVVYDDCGINRYQSRNFDNCKIAIRDIIIDDTDDWGMKEKINEEYDGIWIGDYAFDAGDVADNMGYLSEIFTDLITEKVNDYMSEPDTGNCDEYENYTVYGVITINGHIIDPSVYDYPETQDDVMEITIEGITYNVTIDDCGEYHAEIVNPEPTEPVDAHKYEIYKVLIINGMPECGLSEIENADEFQNCLIEHVKAGWIMVGDIYRDETTVKATVVKG